MQVSIDNLGIIVAFLIPGLVALVGISYFSKTVRQWVGLTEGQAPTFGGAVILLLAALAAGVLADALRELTIDEIHYRTGIQQASFSFADLDEKKLPQFQAIVDNYYCYYQFYGNMLICLLFSYTARLISLRSRAWRPLLRGISDLLVVLLLLGLTFWASRNELAQTDRAISELLPQDNQKERGIK